MADKYDVVNVTPTTIVGAGGIAGPGHLVDIVTKPSGLAGQLRIPAALFTPEAVHQAAHAEATKLEAIKNL
jgi:hypothetical protein